MLPCAHFHPFTPQSVRAEADSSTATIGLINMDMFEPNMTLPPFQVFYLHQELNQLFAGGTRQSFTNEPAPISSPVSSSSTEPATVTSTTPAKARPKPGKLRKNKAQPRPKEISVHKRSAANQQERVRMQRINEALEKLRSMIPWPADAGTHSAFRRKSKISTLRATILYIKHLQQLLGYADVNKNCFDAIPSSNDNSQFV